MLFLLLAIKFEKTCYSVISNVMKFKMTSLNTDDIEYSTKSRWWWNLCKFLEKFWLKKHIDASNRQYYLWCNCWFFIWILNVVKIVFTFFPVYLNSGKVSWLWFAARSWVQSNSIPQLKQEKWFQSKKLLSIIYPGPVQRDRCFKECAFSPPIWTQLMKLIQNQLQVRQIH